MEFGRAGFDPAYSKRTMRLWPLLLVVFGACAGAQEIPKGTFQAGEWCDYDVEAQPSRKERLEIVEVRPDGSYTRRRASDGQVRVYDADHRLVRTENREYKPPHAYGPSFPIRVGQRSVAEPSTVAHSRRPGVTVELRTEIRAVEPDRVVVPAGSFDALRVDLRTNYSMSNGYGNYEEWSLWYPLHQPGKFPVKINYVDYGRDGSKESWSLRACGAAK